MRPMKRPSRLLLLPLLLLVPLGALKWRVEHPPLSPMDKRLRGELASATGVLCTGYGSPSQQLTSPSSPQFAIFGIEKADLDELAANLRCNDEAIKADYDVPHDPPLLLQPVRLINTKSKVPTLHAPAFRYWRTQQGSYLVYVGRNGEELCSPVSPYFVPRFEAFIHRLAQRP